NLWDIPLLGPASTGRTKRVEAPVGGDPVEPGADRGTSLERSEALPRGQQCVLQDVLGVLQGSQHPVAMDVKLSTVRLGQLSERLSVPGPGPGDQVGRQYSSLVSLSRFLQYRHRPNRELGGGECTPIFSTWWCLHL